MVACIDKPEAFRILFFIYKNRKFWVEAGYS